MKEAGGGGGGLGARSFRGTDRKTLGRTPWGTIEKKVNTTHALVETRRRSRTYTRSVSRSVSLFPSLQISRSSKGEEAARFFASVRVWRAFLLAFVRHRMLVFCPGVRRALCAVGMRVVEFDPIGGRREDRSASARRRRSSSSSPTCFERVRCCRCPCPG